MIQIKEREELNNIILEALSRCGVFYSEGYYRYVRSTGDQPFYLFDDDLVMLIVTKKRGPFRFARLPVEYVQYSSSIETDGRLFLDACMDTCRDVLKLHWIHHPEPTALFQETPSRCVRIPYSSHIIDTSLSSEELWSHLKSEFRNRVRKGKSNGVEYVSGGIELLEDFHKVYSEGALRAGYQAAPIKLFRDQHQYLGDQILISIIYHEGTIQGGRLCYCDSHLCYGIFLANAHPAVAGAGNVMDWGLLQDLVAMKVAKLSLAGARVNPAPGSKHALINRYKSTITRNVEPCYLFKVVFDPRIYQLYRLMDRSRAKIRNKPPSLDIIDQEISQWIDINDSESLRRVYGNNLSQLRTNNTSL